MKALDCKTVWRLLRDTLNEVNSAHYYEKFKLRCNAGARLEAMLLRKEGPLLTPGKTVVIRIRRENSISESLCIRGRVGNSSLLNSVQLSPILG